MVFSNALLYNAGKAALFIYVLCRVVAMSTAVFNALVEFKKGNGGVIKVDDIPFEVKTSASRYEIGILQFTVGLTDPSLIGKPLSIFTHGIKNEYFLGEFRPVLATYIPTAAVYSMLNPCPKYKAFSQKEMESLVLELSKEHVDQIDFCFVRLQIKERWNIFDD